MRYVTHIVFSFVLIFCAHPSFSQTPEQLLDSVRANRASEKIFIHYDKADYIAGENIWFKAYIMSGFTPSDYSTTINIDLLNDSGKVIDNKILPVLGSTAIGNFKLSGELSEANYTIRAYTRRMMNFGADNFYYHAFSVYNPSSPKTAAPVQRVYSISFLPEGGNMVASVKNIIAFKATDQWGFPFDVQGRITDSKGILVTSFKSLHDGMGRFELTAANAETYTAECALPNGATKSVILPSALVSGITLQVLKEGQKTYFMVNSTAAFSDAIKPAFVIGVIEDQVVFRVPLPPSEKMSKVIIPESDIPSGILQLTAFNNLNQPLAERLYFVDNNEYHVAGNFKADTVSLEPRQKNNYSFVLEDTIPGTFSVSVVDLDKQVSSRKPENIITKALLTSDLRGYVHEPAWYFDEANKERKQLLDLVMLTNGWRKFKWTDLLNNRLPPMNYQDENFISLKGTAFKVNPKNATATDISVFVKTKDSTNEMVVVPVKADGTFDMSGMIFEDTATLYFQHVSPKKREILVQPSSLPLSYQVKLKSYSPAPPARPWFVADKDPLSMKVLYSDVLKNLDKNVVILSEVTIKADRRTPTQIVEQRYTKGVFKTFAATTIDFITDPPGGSSYLNIIEYLKGRLSSVNVIGGPGNYLLNYRASRSITGGPIPMAIFLDEMQLQSANELATLPVSQIAMVKVYRTGFVGAFGSAAGGALAIYTRKHTDILPNTPGYMQNIPLEGYSPVKEFYSPDYSKTNEPAYPDNRVTLYWNPYLISTAADRTIRIPFYNSNRAKNIKVVLEGMTEDGRLLHLEKTIN